MAQAARLSAGRPPLPTAAPYGPYVIDFFCPAVHLAVEVDGYVHGTGDIHERDQRRDAWLKEQGVIILRIPASNVMADPDEEADMIWRVAMALISSTAKQS